MKDKIKNNLNNIKEVTDIRADYELMDIDYIDKEDERKTIIDADEFDVLYYIQHLQNEIERLNNIINELEKYLQENINNIYAYFDNAPFGVEETYKEVLSKLQELKGSDKE